MFVIRREQLRTLEEGVNEDVARAVLEKLARDWSGRTRVPEAQLPVYVRRAITEARARGISGREATELYVVLAALHGPRFPDVPSTRWASRLLAPSPDDDDVPEDLFVHEAQHHLNRLASEDACRAVPPSSPAPNKSASS